MAWSVSAPDTTGALTYSIPIVPRVPCSSNGRSSIVSRMSITVRTPAACRAERRGPDGWPPTTSQGSGDDALRMPAAAARRDMPSSIGGRNVYFTGTMPSITVALCQFRPTKGLPAANLDQIERVFAMVAAAPSPPSVLVFPEAMLTGYFLEGGVREHAMSADDVFLALRDRH